MKCREEGYKERVRERDRERERAAERKKRYREKEERMIIVKGEWGEGVGAATKAKTAEKITREN